MPTLSLQGGVDNVFNRDGAGSSRADAAGRDHPGRPGPTCSGSSGSRRRCRCSPGSSARPQRAQAGIDLEQLKVERAGAAQAVEQRVRAALETAASSYAAIALTREASDAASRNYELVSDAYARGTASITALIDAQNAAESSAEAAANAVHDFLLDLMRVERAMGDFGVLRPAEQQQAFLERLHTLWRSSDEPDALDRRRGARRDGLWGRPARTRATLAGDRGPGGRLVRRPRRDALQRRDQGGRVGGPGVPRERHRGRDHPGARGRRPPPRDPGRRPVRKGQVLARLRQIEYRDQVADAEATLRQARGGL